MQRFLKLFIGEFRALFRDEGAVLVIVAAPLIYAFIYSLCYGPQVVQGVPIAVVDNDHSLQSEELVRKLNSGSRLKVIDMPSDMSFAEELLKSGDVFAILYIPQSFSKNILSNTSSTLPLYIDASNFVIYRTILEHVEAVAQGMATAPLPILYAEHNLYNPSLGYGTYLLPAIYVLVLQQTLLLGLALYINRGKNGRRYGCCNPLLKNQNNFQDEI